MSNLDGARFVWHRFCCIAGNIELKKSSEIDFRRLLGETTIFY
ncbi:hypothetical protein NEIMUCOT_04183 [Neisseria mucosa ATCC 25996]|uniref:Uncharacterized protein n=1 Tax=Neisseria mucosa (strain ATCC 25996 / DSM 4631 / NCTC 10774 / M26) TaxID=546266 RepID=D2ZU95_NEIM2|nr:hypothetical protein NEIMUCOT_04183 [Neisseria mucosa ATCC 25996]